MEEELREKIRKDTEEGEGDIPKFLLYHGKKAFGTGVNRAYATVMYVQCRAECCQAKRTIGKGEGNPEAGVYSGGLPSANKP